MGSLEENTQGRKDHNQFPRCLADIQKGSQEPGDAEHFLSDPPDWLDKEKFRRGQAFYRNHADSLLRSQHFSLTVGFCIINLLEPLVFTNKSNTPKKALARYMQTALHILSWVYDEIWDDPKSRGSRSIETVKRMHKHVGASMAKKFSHSGRVYVSQYDMGLVQCGFMGAIVMYTEYFGVVCSKSDLEDYIHYWRGIGWLLGIEDKYNICSGNYEETFAICKEIERKLLIPGLESPPQDFDMMVNAYIDGLNIMAPLRLSSFQSIHFLMCEAMDLPVPAIDWKDRLRCYALKFLSFLIRWCPGWETFLNARVKYMFEKMSKELHVDLQAKDYSAHSKND